MSFAAVARLARDPDLRREAGPLDVLVVLEILGRGDLDLQSRFELERPGFIKQLLVARQAFCPALDVDVMDAAPQRPPLRTREFLGRHLDREVLRLPDAAPPRMRRVQRLREPIQIAAVRRGYDRDRSARRRVPPDLRADRADEHILDLALSEPSHDGHRLRLQMAKTRGVVDRTGFDPGSMTFQKHGGP